MKAKRLILALAASGLIGTGAIAWHEHLKGPMSEAQASAFSAPTAAATTVPARAAAATPMAGGVSLPVNGFTELVARYGPAVVNISVEGSATQARMDAPDMPGIEPGDPFYDFFRRFQQPAPNGRIPLHGQGSGFIVTPDGYILTNAHVVDGASIVSVRLTDRREFKAKVVGKDKQTDVALLKIDAKDLPIVKIGSSTTAKVGEWVVAIGSPFGFENSATAGIVSAKARSLPDAAYVPFIQTDVAVNPGNSGGPLFNLAGEVIGINSQIYSRTGGYQGLSFAVPIDVAVKVKDQLLAHGKVTRGRLGVTIQEVNAALAGTFGLERPRGALVASVDEGSAAQKAGIEVGDVILAYDGKSIDRSLDLPLLVADTAPGSKATVEVWRKNAKKTLTVTIGKPGGEKVASDDTGDAHPARLGLAVRALSAEERHQIGGRGGLLVEEVSGPAERAGIQPGDVVLSLNGNPVRSVEQLRDAVGKAGKNIALLIQRNDRQLFVPVELG